MVRLHIHQNGVPLFFHGLTVRSSRNYPNWDSDTAPAWLPDYQLVFDTYSSARQGGAANVIPRKGYAVPGMVYKVRRGGWRVLNIKEGAPFFYRKKEIMVLPHTGDTALMEYGDKIVKSTFLLRRCPANLFVVPSCIVNTDPEEVAFVPPLDLVRRFQCATGSHRIRNRTSGVWEVGKELLPPA